MTKMLEVFVLIILIIGLLSGGFSYSQNLKQTFSYDQTPTYETYYPYEDINQGYAYYASDYEHYFGYTDPDLGYQYYIEDKEKYSPFK